MAFMRDAILPTGPLPADCFMPIDAVARRGIMGALVAASGESGGLRRLFSCGEKHFACAEGEL